MEYLFALPDCSILHLTTVPLCLHFIITNLMDIEWFVCVLLWCFCTGSASNYYFYYTGSGMRKSYKFSTYIITPKRFVQWEQRQKAFNICNITTYPLQIIACPSRKHFSRIKSILMIYKLENLILHISAITAVPLM